MTTITSPAILSTDPIIKTKFNNTCIKQLTHYLPQKKMLPLQPIIQEDIPITPATQDYHTVTIHQMMNHTLYVHDHVRYPCYICKEMIVGHRDSPHYILEHIHARRKFTLICPTCHESFSHSTPR